MDGKTENTLAIVLYGLLAVALTFVVLQNFNDPWLLIFLSGLLTVSITLRNAVLYTSGRMRRIGQLSLLLDILLVFLINRIDKGGSSQIYYLVLIGDASIAYSYQYSGIIAVLSYGALIFERYLSSSGQSFMSFLPGAAYSSLAFIATYLIMYIVKYEIKQREKLSATMYELKVRTKQLEGAYAKLKEASEELEEITILKERNRIAREIHDTVGHTLMTVLLEIEAGERLIRIDPDTAVEKLRLAKGQVRKGLGDIRESVGTLKAGREILDFAPSIRLLLDETTRHGNIYINSEIGNLPKLTPLQEKTLYRALQEGLTNGIRHGKSTAFVFKLTHENENIKFLLQDNGEGTDKIVQGFGLTAMGQRVKEAGGIMNITSKHGEGFCIKISIPVGEIR